MNEYTRMGEEIIQVVAIEPGCTLSFHATDVVQRATGKHAYISIRVEGVEIGASLINIQKDEERQRLANKAHGLLPPTLARNNGTDADAKYYKQDLDRDFRVFCAGLWQARIDLDRIQMTATAGDVDPSPVRFVLKPFLVEQGGTILFAKPGKGKSYIVALMAVSIDAAGEIPTPLWPGITPRRVAVVNLERSEASFAKRLGNINAALGLPRGRTLQMVHARGRSLADVQYAVQRGMDQCGAEVLVLDSISRAGLGDLNENADVNRIMDLLNRLAPTWLAIAHAPRASDEHIFGGIHFDAAADVVVRIAAQQDEDGGGPLGVGLRITKENDIGKHPQQILHLTFDGDYGLQTVRHARGGEFTELEAGKDSDLRTDVVDYLREVLHANATRIAEQTGHNRSNVATLLKDTRQFRRLGRNGQGVDYGLADTAR